VQLETVGLRKDYRVIHALKATDLTVKMGEFLTLLGPSGSGKTTLLMMIAGLTEPSGGNIRLDGVDITDRPAYQRNLGMVFQNYALFPHMTVEENIAFPLKMRGLNGSQIKSAVADALAIVRLEHLAQRKPLELSGGQQQRVAFARAIVFKPSLVLMDEPLAALDKKLRDELKGEIRRLHRELGTTVIYVTHDQDEAMMLSDRICLMNDAAIVQIDSPSDLYNRPQSTFAAEFIGESNLFDATVQLSQDGKTAFSLSENGPTLWSSHGAPSSTTGRQTLLVRPERIGIVPAASIAVGAELDAEVKGIINLGGLYRITCVLSNGKEVKVSALGQSAMPVWPGDRVRLSIDTSDVVPISLSEKTSEAA
jgi:putative spermidine/putrescine transport system ATP-binding protein